MSLGENSEVWFAGDHLAIKLEQSEELLKNLGLGKLDDLFSP